MGAQVAPANTLSSFFRSLPNDSSNRRVRPRPRVQALLGNCRVQRRAVVALELFVTPASPLPKPIFFLSRPSAFSCSSTSCVTGSDAGQVRGRSRRGRHRPHPQRASASEQQPHSAAAAGATSQGLSVVAEKADTKSGVMISIMQRSCKHHTMPSWFE